MSKTILRAVAGVAALAAIALGASAIAGADDKSGSVAAGARSGMPGGMPGGGRDGRMPPGFGARATGAAAAKAKAAALDRYPGTVERVMKLPDGSYVVDVVRSGGSELHVLVSKQFKVTGADKGGPGHGRPPRGAMPPPGAMQPPPGAMPPPTR